MVSPISDESLVWCPQVERGALAGDQRARSAEWSVMAAPRSEEGDVQGVRLCLRSGPSEVQEVGSARRVAVRRVLQLEHGGEGVGVRWVAGLVVEVRRAVEDARVQ